MAVTSKLHSFFGMGNCVQLRFPHLQQKYLALALFSLLPWFYYLWHSTAEDRGICIFKCSLPIKLTGNFSLTGSLFCIRALLSAKQFFMPAGSLPKVLSYKTALAFELTRSPWCTHRLLTGCQSNSQSGVRSSS